MTAAKVPTAGMAPGSPALASDAPVVEVVVALRVALCCRCDMRYCEVLGGYCERVGNKDDWCTQALDAPVLIVERLAHVHISVRA